MADRSGAGAAGQELPGINHTASRSRDTVIEISIANRFTLGVMKITGPSNTSSASAARGAGRATSGGVFSLSTAEAAEAAADAQRMAGLDGVMTVSALLALQGVEDPLSRKKRAMGRAGRILDMLDDLKVAMLEGAASPATLDNLARTVREERAATDDPGLEDVLNQIETRAAVELAKLGRHRAA